MKPILIITGVIVTFILIVLCIVGGYIVSTMNREQSLRNLVEAKQTDNTNEFDNMKKKLKNIVELPEAQTKMLMDIIVGNATARAEQGKGSLFAMVKEAVPTVSTEIFDKIFNEVVASRNAWTMRQKELIDLNRVHTDVITLFPSSLICSVLDRKEIKITIVTSGATKEAFITGEDNDTSLGLKNK